MASQSGHFLHWGIFPGDYLVQRIAVGRDYLIDSLWEHKVADLWASVNVVDGLQGVSVPEPNASVGSSSSWSKKTVLMGRPTDGFDSSSVVRELGLGLGTGQRPNHQLVVVSTWSQLLSVETPLQTADFLSVTLKLHHNLLTVSEISVENVMVAAASTDLVPVPSYCSNPWQMASEIADLHALLSVPDLSFSRVSSNG